MTQYLMTVHGPAEIGEYGSYGSKEEMEEAFADTGAFTSGSRARATGSSPGASRHPPRPP